MRALRIEVRPSRSLAFALVPAAAPVTRALDPDVVVPSCFAPAQLVAAGLLFMKRPFAGAVSVPSGFTIQPRRTSMSSSYAPQRAAVTDAPRTLSGHQARSIRY